MPHLSDASTTRTAQTTVGRFGFYSAHTPQPAPTPVQQPANNSRWEYDENGQPVVRGNEEKFRLTPRYDGSRTSEKRRKKEPAKKTATQDVLQHSGSLCRHVNHTWNYYMNYRVILTFIIGLTLIADLPLHAETKLDAANVDKILQARASKDISTTKPKEESAESAEAGSAKNSPFPKSAVTHRYHKGTTTRS